MDARVGACVSTKKTGAQSAVNLDFVGDYGALFVAHGFNVGDRKAAVAQVRKRTLQCLVQFVLKSGSLLGRSENAGVDTILLAVTIVRKKDQLHLLRCGGWHANLRLIAEPAGRREQHED